MAAEFVLGFHRNVKACVSVVPLAGIASIYDGIQVLYVHYHVVI
jgi:hypothetical protein